MDGHGQDCDVSGNRKAVRHPLAKTLHLGGTRPAFASVLYVLEMHFGQRNNAEDHLLIRCHGDEAYFKQPTIFWRIASVCCCTVDGVAPLAGCVHVVLDLLFQDLLFMLRVMDVCLLHYSCAGSYRDKTGRITPTT